MQSLDQGEIRRRLEEQRDQLRREIYARTEGDEVVTPRDPLYDWGGVDNYDADDADAVSDADREQAMVRNAQRLLHDVEAALARLDAGTYGKCVRCGRDINPRRLDALPAASYCLDCQEAVERGAPAQRG